MKKRILAILMSLALCVGLLPVAASADGEIAEVWAPDMQTHIGDFTTMQAAISAAKEAGQYGGIKLLQNVTITENLTLDTDINLFLNGHTLTLASGVTVGKGELQNTYATIDLFNDTSSSQNPGTFEINGTLEANVCQYEATITVNDGGFVEMIDAYEGTINISGGSVHSLITDGGTYNISGGVMCVDMFDNHGGEDVQVTVTGDACLYFSGMNGIMVSSPQDWDYGFHLTLEGGYYDADPRQLYSDKYWHIDDESWMASAASDEFTYVIKSGDTYAEIAKADITSENLGKGADEDGSIFIPYAATVTVDESKIEQYSGQTDWAVENTNVYKWRIAGSGGSSPTPVTPTAAVATAPTANALTYTGAAQALVTAGTATNGTMQYALGENATAAPTSGWSASIPTGTDAGTYYVWYKAAGSSGYADSTPQAVTASISTAAPAVTAPTVKTNLSYTGQAQTLISAGTVSGGTFLYALGSDGQTAPTNFGQSIPVGTDAGSYYVWYGVAGDANHNSIAPTFAGEAVIAPAAVTVTAVNRSITIGGTLPDLSSPAQGTDYTVTGLADGDALDGTVEMKYTKYDDLTYVLTPDTNAPGTYRIVIEGAAAPAGGNYDSAVSFVNGTLTVSAPYVDYGDTEPSARAEEPTVVTETETLADGSKVETKTETKSETKADGSIVETTTVTETTTGTDGSKVEATSETVVTTQTKVDGSTVEKTEASETVVATDADGAKTTTETKVEATETLDADGNGTVERTTTEKITDAEGNVVTTVTESKGTIETDEAGTKTTTVENTITTTDAEGNVTTETTTEQKGETADGSVGTTVKDSEGKLLSAELTLSDAAVEKALKTGEPIAAPMTVPTADAENAADAEPVQIDMPALTGEDGGELKVTDMPRVEIPVSVSGPGVIAMTDDGTGEPKPVKECYEGSVIVPVSGPCKLVIADNTKVFSDVAADSWFFDAVTFVTAREIFNGMGDGVFAPGGFMTRGMMAQVLYNFDREAAATGLTPFADAAGKWYADAASWANGAKIVEGTDLGFEGEITIPREQVATMLYRYAKYLGLDVSAEASLDVFPDGGETADWAADAMRWAVSVGLFRGNDDGTLNPKGTATRAEIATLMERMVKVILK